MAPDTSTAVRRLALNRLVLHHSALLSQLEVLLNDIVNDDLLNSPQRRFLQLVHSYNLLTNDKTTTTTDWNMLFQQIVSLWSDTRESTDSVLHFFLLNYQFLTLRNATTNDKGVRELRRIVLSARDALAPFEGPLLNLFSGFLDFNVARWEHRLGNTEAAKASFLRAVGARVEWFRHVERMCEEPIIVCAAAEQVRKLPGAFTQMFPDDVQPMIEEEILQKAIAIAPGDREVKKV